MNAPGQDDSGEAFYAQTPPLSPRARAAAAIGWSSFLGAVVATPVYLYAGATPGAGLGQMSGVFLAAWLAALVPAAMSWLLAGRAPRRAPMHQSPTDEDA